MLAIAVLFFLGLWVLITLVAMRIGYKQLKKRWAKPYAGRLGAFLGFMLTMGGFMVYWAAEYAYIQYKVTKLCESEGGITVYVTPEQWRQQIGEKEWATLTEDWKNIDHDLTFQFNDKIYYGSTQLNRRVISYAAKDERRDMIGDSDKLYIDKTTNQVLFRRHYFSVGVPAIANSLTGLKFWLDDINDCYIGDWSEEDRFFHRKYTNYSIKKGD